MRLKAIPLWEQHIEKLVLGLLVIALLAVVVLEIISAPNAMEVRVDGSSKTLSPAQLNQELIDYALGQISPKEQEQLEVPARDSDAFKALTLEVLLSRVGERWGTPGSREQADQQRKPNEGYYRNSYIRLYTNVICEVSPTEKVVRSRGAN